MTDAKTRQATFEKFIADADPKQLDKAVDFGEHRYVSLERDALTANRYARGHKSMRGACRYLERVVEEGEPLVPEKLIDLDTGKVEEIDLFVHVAPKSVDAVSVMLPRSAADFALNALNHVDRDTPELGRAWKAATVAFEQAIDRRLRRDHQG